MTLIGLLNKLIDDHQEYLKGKPSLLRSYVAPGGIRLELYKQGWGVKYKVIKNNKVISILSLDGIERSPEDRKAEVTKAFTDIFSKPELNLTGSYMVSPNTYKLPPRD